MGKAQEQKETPQERAFAEVAAAKMADYRKRWLPLQNKLAEGIKASGKPGSFERQQAAGKTATENAIRFGEAQAGLEGALTDSGAGAGSSKFKLSTAGLGNDQATSRGLGFVASDQAIDDAYLQGLGMLTQLGRGEAAQATEGMASMARRSAEQAQQDAEISASRRAGNAQLVGQVAGFGLAGGFNGAGDRLQAKFSQTAPGASGFGTGLAYGNQDMGAFL